MIFDSFFKICIQNFEIFCDVWKFVHNLSSKFSMTFENVFKILNNLKMRNFKWYKILEEITVFCLNPLLYIHFSKILKNLFDIWSCNKKICQFFFWKLVQKIWIASFFSIKNFIDITFQQSPIILGWNIIYLNLISLTFFWCLFLFHHSTISVSSSLSRSLPDIIMGCGHKNSCNPGLQTSSWFWFTIHHLFSLHSVSLVRKQWKSHAFFVCLHDQARS